MDYHPLRSYGFRCLAETKVEIAGRPAIVKADQFLDTQDQPDRDASQRAALRLYTVAFEGEEIQALNELELIQLMGMDSFEKLPDGLEGHDFKGGGWKY